MVSIGVILCIIGDTENGMRVIAIGGIAYLGSESIVDIARAIWSSNEETTKESAE